MKGDTTGEPCLGHLYRFSKDREYRHNCSTNGLPRMLKWADGTPAESEDGRTSTAKPQASRPTAGAAKALAAAAAVAETTQHADAAALIKYTGSKGAENCNTNACRTRGHRQS